MLRQSWQLASGFPQEVELSGKIVMKRSLLFLVLVALSIGCYKERHPQLRTVKGLSTESTTWKGTPGTAVTIQFKDGTEQFWRAEMVEIDFAPPPTNRRVGWMIMDFSVPVMKREPQALTLFFTNDYVLEQLPDQIEAGTLRVIPCAPHTVCGGSVWTSDL